MSYKATVFRVMIASPSDVGDERRMVSEVIYAWNAVHSPATGAVLLPVKWETHSTPEMGARPQSIINRQLVGESDVLIGIFWTRLGTPTGEAESGSVEEIRKFIADGKPIQLYFSNAPVMPERVDLEQYSKLKQFKESCLKEGLVETYDSTPQLQEKLSRHLVVLVRELQGRSEKEIGFIWTDDHYDALSIYTSPRRTYEIFSIIAKKPKSFEEILESVPGDETWLEAIIDEMIALDLIRLSIDRTAYRLTERGRQLKEALDQIPQSIKAQAYRDVWGVLPEASY